MHLRRRHLLALALLAALWGCRKPAPETTPPAQSPPPAPAPAASALAPPDAAPAPLPPDPKLDYTVRVTGGAPNDATLPLVLAVHGLGDTPERFGRLLTDVRVPLRIVLPRGPYDYPVGYSWFGTQIEGGRVTGLDLDEISQSAQRLAHLAQRLARQYPTRGKPVLTGFSQGGVLAFAVAARHPDAISRAIPISGLLPEALWPAPRRGPAPSVVIRALHGQADPLVPVAGARQTVAQLKKRGFDATLQTFPDVPHRITPAMRHALESHLAAQIP